MSIGQSLAQARRDAGLSVQQVSAATRIRALIVTAVEADDFSRSGGDFYARAHIRTIAAAVHADPAALLAEYDATYGAAPALRASAIFESETHTKRERRGPNWSAAMAAALALVVVYAAVQLLGGIGDKRVLQAASEPTPHSSVVASPAKRPHPAPASAPPRLVAQAPRDQVTVDLAAPKGTAWIRVTGGTGKQLFEGNVSKGQQRTFTDSKKLRFVIGNAGAVDLTVNGVKLGAPGRLGEVVRPSFTPSDPVGG